MTREVSPLDASDYAAIEAAVMETSRGRWFLAEHARRNRHADTLMLLGAMARLEAAVRGEDARPREVLRASLAETGAGGPALLEPHAGPDALLGDGVKAPEPPATDLAASRRRSDPLALLEALTPEERIALFT